MPVRFATRLNSFGSRPDLAGWQAGHWPTPRISSSALRRRMASPTSTSTIPIMSEPTPAEIARVVADAGLAINGFAMRYYTNPAFKLGAFTNPGSRRAAGGDRSDQARHRRARGGRRHLMTLWLGQDGFDYPFQCDYARAWDLEIEGIREVAEHDPDCHDQHRVQAERAARLQPSARLRDDAARDREIGAPNLGVTLDFAHVLYADEQPAFAAALVARKPASGRPPQRRLRQARRRADGGTVHPCRPSSCCGRSAATATTARSISTPSRMRSGLDPVAECDSNIATVEPHAGRRRGARNATTASPMRWTGRTRSRRAAVLRRASAGAR